ncbi:MAG: amidohydrolase family protein, partial [Rhodoglobus sp.]|nr:amidohydrolase family protein [Rhodoglobus sp.]
SVRIRAFVNIASVGTTSILLGGELKGLYYSNEDVAVECIESNRDLVVGVKVRASNDVGGENAPEALRRARRVADRVKLPLMVHLGPAPATIDEIADTLRAGDIITHAFTGWEGNTVVADGVLRPSIRAARDRGVLLDIGHGMSGFSSAVARSMIELGELPDTISSDLHTYSQTKVIDLPTVLAKFMALGMSLEDVLARATLAPARAAGLDALGVGTLAPGAPADIAVFRLDSRAMAFGDGFGSEFQGEQAITPVLTVIDGTVAFRSGDA